MKGHLVGGIQHISTLVQRGATNREFLAASRTAG
jgi:hypothetical protein